MLPRGERLKLDKEAFEDRVVHGLKLKEIAAKKEVSLQVIAYRVERHREVLLALGMPVPKPKGRDFTP